MSRAVRTNASVNRKSGFKQLSRAQKELLDVYLTSAALDEACTTLRYARGEDALRKIRAGSPHRNVKSAATANLAFLLCEDDGMDYKTFGEPQEVHAPLGEPRSYEVHGRLENLPIPEPESGDTEELSGFLLLGLWNDHLVKSAKQTGPPLIKAVVRVNGAVRKTLTGPALAAPIVLTKLSAKTNSTVRLTLVDQDRNQKFAKATYKPCRTKSLKKPAVKKT